MALQSQVVREEWFSGSVVAVTGGARGIGAATVRAFSEAGASVASLDLDPPSAAGNALVEQCDVSSPADVAKAFAAIEAKLSARSTYSVNNAGVNAGYDPVAMSPEEWDGSPPSTYARCGSARAKCFRACVNANPGSIVNVASIQANLTQAGAFPYAAAKANMLGLTRSLALEEGPFGVRVNAVSAGYARTRLVVDSLQATGDSEAAERAIAAKHALPGDRGARRNREHDRSCSPRPWRRSSRAPLSQSMAASAADSPKRSSPPSRS